MSMAADVFVGLCYNAYGLVINAIQKPVYVKITTIQYGCNNILALQYFLLQYNTIQYDWQYNHTFQIYYIFLSVS